METAFFAIASTHPSIFSAILSRRSSLPVVIAASLLVARGGLSQILWTRYVVVGSCFMYFFVASRTEESFCIIGIPAGITLSLSLSLWSSYPFRTAVASRRRENIICARLFFLWFAPFHDVDGARTWRRRRERKKDRCVGAFDSFFFSVVYFSVENGGHKLTLTAGL